MSVEARWVSPDVIEHEREIRLAELQGNITPIAGTDGLTTDSISDNCDNTVDNCMPNTLHRWCSSSSNVWLFDSDGDCDISTHAFTKVSGTSVLCVQFDGNTSTGSVLDLTQISYPGYGGGSWAGKVNGVWIGNFEFEMGVIYNGGWVNDTWQTQSEASCGSNCCYWPSNEGSQPNLPYAGYPTYNATIMCACGSGTGACLSTPNGCTGY